MQQQVRKVYLVLDGKRRPLKAATNQERDRKRRENLEAARWFRQQSNSHNTHQQREQMHEKSFIKVIDLLEGAVVVARV